MTKTSPFFDIFFTKLERVNEVLEKYRNDPNEENIHDIRTSIRRLEAAYSIFPKSSKTKTSAKLIKKLKFFFSLNNKIRDFDIILAKLQDSGYEPESKLVLTLTKNKLKRISKSLKYADNLANIKKPKIKENLKINSKFEKILLSLIQEFQNYVPIVIDDESKVEELHAMRKTIKKLRYILELNSSDSYCNLILQMKKLQQFLGDIHDCDIFVWYFEKRINEFPEVLKIMENEKRKRSTIYQNLVSVLTGFVN